MLGQPLNSVEGTEFVLATLPATQCDRQGQKPSVIDHDRSIRMKKVWECVRQTPILWVLSSLFTSFHHGQADTLQTFTPGQVKISKNIIINVGEKYHPLNLKYPYMAMFNDFQWTKPLLHQGFWGFTSVFWGEGIPDDTQLSPPSCGARNSARSRRGSRSEARPSKRCAGSPRQIWVRKG